MATEKIEVIFTTDDSELMESFEDIQKQTEELEEATERVERAVQKANNPRPIKRLGEEVDKTKKKTKDFNKTVDEGSGSMTKYTKAGGRGVSMLSRFGGVGGRATRSLGGLAFALGGTPFGAFALAAAAATAAYALFADKLGLNNAEIIAKNNELKENIGELLEELEQRFESGKLLAIDLKNLSEAEKKLAKIDVLKEAIGREQVNLGKTQELQLEAEFKLSQNQFKSENSKLETEKASLMAKKEANEIASRIAQRQKEIQDLEKGITDEVKKGNEARKSANEDRKKDIEDMKKLFESLVRNELEKRLIALDNEAKARKDKALELKIDKKEIDRFIIASDEALKTDREKVIKEFADAEQKARRALLSQLVIDEQKAAIDAAKAASDIRLKDIEEIAKDDAEKADLIKLNETKLQNDLLAIDKEFDEKRKAENLSKQQENFSLQSAALETDIALSEAQLGKQLEIERQAFDAISHTELEITAFKELQDDARLTAELNYQIERLKLVRDFNKEINDVERAALDAQISLLETRLQGVGAKVQKTASDGAKKGDGLFGLMGISADTQSDIQAVQGALEQVTAEISKAVAERIEILQKEIDFRNQRVSEIQADLANEIELNKLGKASNIAEVQKQLESEKALRAKAEQDKKEAAEAQFALDTVIQASNLITAISGLYSSLAGLPFGIGVAIATALAAVMVGSFIASKASAADAAGFAGGGWTGNMATDKVAGVVHGREFVVDAETTKELGLENKSMKEAKEIMLGNHQGDSSPNMEQNRKKNKAISNQITKNEVEKQQRAHSMYNDTVTKAVNEGNKTLRAILNKPTVIPLPNGKIKVITGNTTEIYSVSN